MWHGFSTRASDAMDENRVIRTVFSTERSAWVETPCHDQQARTMKSNSDASSLHVFGVRHHGPGSARSVRRALEELKPACVLVEGPPDGEAVMPLLAHKEMKPPVAMLIYVPDDPR